MELDTIKCPACGADISFSPGTRTSKCEYCGTVATLGNALEAMEADTNAEFERRSAELAQREAEVRRHENAAADYRNALVRWRKKARIPVFLTGLLWFLGGMLMEFNLAAAGVLLIFIATGIFFAAPAIMASNEPDGSKMPGSPAPAPKKLVTAIKYYALCFASGAVGLILAAMVSVIFFEK
jgi:hypothetical protein